jgi:hypothetical protein
MPITIDAFRGFLTQQNSALSSLSDSVLGSAISQVNMLEDLANLGKILVAENLTIYPPSQQYHGLILINTANGILYKCTMVNGIFAWSSLNIPDADKQVLSATKLSTPRTINGVSFDGTANIAVNTDNIQEGTTPSNKWFTNARAIASTLTGFAASGTRSVISATDSTLSAFGKIQKYLSDLSTVAFSGSYTDLLNKPSIPAGQVNSDWNSSSGISQILNKPDLTTYQAKTITTRTISESTTLTSADSGTVVFVHNLTAITITLPTPSVGLNITLKRVGTGLDRAVTIVSSGGETIDTVTSYVLNGTLDGLCIMGRNGTWVLI